MHLRSVMHLRYPRALIRPKHTINVVVNGVFVFLREFLLGSVGVGLCVRRCNPDKPTNTPTLAKPKSSGTLNNRSSHSLSFLFS